MIIDVNKEYFTASGLVVTFNKDKIEKLTEKFTKPIALEVREKIIHKEDYPETEYVYGVALQINKLNTFLMYEITWKKSDGYVVICSLPGFQYAGFSRDSISDLNIVDEYNMPAYVKYRNKKLDQLMKTKYSINDKISKFVLEGGSINRESAIAFDSTLKEFVDVNDNITKLYNYELGFLQLYKRDNPEEIVYLDIIAKVLERHLQDGNKEAYSNFDVAKQVIMLKVHGFDFY